MKKICVLLVSALLAVTLIGCSGKESHETEIKAAVDGFFQEMQAGDAAKAESYLTDDCQDDFGINGITGALDAQLEGLDLGETFEAESQEFMKNIVSQAFESYTIDSVKENSSGGTVTVSGKCLDFDNLDFSESNADITALSEQYTNEHLEELQKIYMEQGEDAMTEAIMSGLVPMLYDTMEQTAKDTPRIDFNASITVVEQDGQWLISAIKNQG